MEQENLSEIQVESEIEKSQKIVIRTFSVLILLFSSAIIGSLLYFGKNETVVLNDKLDTLTVKVDSLSQFQKNVENSLYKINEQLDKTIEDNQVVITNINSVDTKVSNVKSKVDTLVAYSKK